ncbi:HalOD1 output domain-containing protein [Halobacteriales archaeon Cl-PHB]
MTPTLDGPAADASVVERIVAAVATERNVDVTELDPLYDVVDPEAVESLVGPGLDGYLTFSYHGLQIFVHGDGRVEVGPSDVQSVSSTA